MFAVLSGMIVGVFGYALLSHMFYDIPASATAMSEWISGAMYRPESSEKIWGVAKNITIPNMALMIVNQFFYTILIPGLFKTRAIEFYSQYSPAGWISLVLWTATFTTATYHIGSAICRESKNRKCFSLYAFVLAGIWFFTRLIFYTWWDPFDPFLFAVMATPALWLILILGFSYAQESDLGKWKWRAHLALLIMLTISVWIHNYYYMIRPLRESCF
jgi:hypothetical protein